MFKISQEVTLVEENEYERGLTISTEDIGEITDIVEDFEGTRYVVHFQELVDSEGVTPCVWVTEDEIDRA